MSDEEVNDENTTVLCREIIEAFAPHARTSQPKDDSFSGWDVCPDWHDDELDLQCSTNKPYSTLHLMEVTLAEAKSHTSLDRPISAQAAPKSRKKFMSSSASNLTIRKSKSTRCISTSNGPMTSPYRIFCNGSSTAPPSGRSGYGSTYPKRQHRATSDPSLRYITKFPMLFHGIKDIAYEFNHYPQHHQHIEAYRNSYTYILIRNFRDLRATGLAGTKLHAALRFNMCSNSDNKHNVEGSCRHRERCQHTNQPSSTQTTRKPTVTPPPVIYYSETCPTGPVIYSRGGSGKSNSSRVSDSLMTTVNPTSICSGCSALPKSTMEMNSMMVKSSQQRPFGEQECGFKGHKSLVKSPRPWKQPASEMVRRRKNSSASTPAMSMVIGSSAVSKQSTGIRKMSPLGRVPVAVRRSSPSIRGKRDPSGSTVEGAKYLSIAMATHTVTSPYYRTNDDVDDTVRML